MSGETGTWRAIGFQFMPFMSKFFFSLNQKIKSGFCFSLPKKYTWWAKDQWYFLKTLC